MASTKQSTAKPPAPRSAETANQYLELAHSGQVTTIDAARMLTEFVDDVVPLGGEGSHRRKVIDGAFNAAEALAKSQIGFMRSAARGVTFVNVAVDVNAFNGTDVDVNVDTDVEAPIGRHLRAA